jgi:hypothetical protein
VEPVKPQTGAAALTPTTSIREALRSLPSLAATSTGQPPKLDEIFFPESHAEVLDPDVSLVIGNRGMGKTFWTLALSDNALRPEIAKRYLGTRRLRFDDLDVYLGFADPEGAFGAVARPDLESVPKNTPAELIWRAVLLKVLAPAVNQVIPQNFRELVEWVGTRSDEQLATFRAADEIKVQNQRRVLFLFDQLDQLATDWNRIQELTQGLVKIALAMKSYRSLKIKLFMRPDQAENKQLFRFPDASKILGGSRVLTWRATDLYGLLFFEILRVTEARGAFREICRKALIRANELHPRLNIPAALVGDRENQGAVFDAIAGELMGRGLKRGRPYTWIPTHLADGRGEISPRTFLQVLKTAAEWDAPPPRGTAIDFNGIQEGVRRASGTRLIELEENYPWVSMALEPLRGLVVPCTSNEIASRWMKKKTVDAISSRYGGSSAPIDLVLANLTGPKEEAVLMKLLTEIGVFEVRENGKINIPDIFRVKAGILRKGGVTPQQRRRL